jgi:hypothetical protein
MMEQAGRHTPIIKIIKTCLRLANTHSLLEHNNDSPLGS